MQKKLEKGINLNILECNSNPVLNIVLCLSKY